MANDIDTTETEGLEPETIAAAQWVAEQMRQEEEELARRANYPTLTPGGTMTVSPPVTSVPAPVPAPVAPTASFDQAAAFVPTRTLDLSRPPVTPQQVVPPRELGSRTIPLPRTTIDPMSEMFQSASRYGVPIDTLIKAQTAQRQFEAQRRVESAIAGGMAPERALAMYAGTLFPGIRTLPQGMFRGATPPPSKVVGNQLAVWNPQIGRYETQVTAPHAAPARDIVFEKTLDALNADIRQAEAHVTRLQTTDPAAADKWTEYLGWKRAERNRIISDYERRQGAETSPAPTAPSDGGPSVVTQPRTPITGRKAEKGYQIGRLYPSEGKIFEYLGGPVDDITNSWKEVTGKIKRAI